MQDNPANIDLISPIFLSLVDVPPLPPSMILFDRIGDPSADPAAQGRREQ
jgi:hypothetical protein